MTDAWTLDAWVDLSLHQRCRKFEERHPDAKLSVYHLRKNYREAGIRKKMIRKTQIVGEDKQMEMKEQATAAGYAISSSVLDAQNFGAPQSRERSWIILYNLTIGGTPMAPCER